MALTDWQFNLKSIDSRSGTISVEFHHIPSGRDVSEILNVPPAANATWLNNTLANTSAQLEKRGQTFLFLNNLTEGLIAVTPPAPPVPADPEIQAFVNDVVILKAMVNGVALGIINQNNTALATKRTGVQTSLTANPSWVIYLGNG